MVITVKKLFSFLMVIFLMIGVCGCTMKNQDKIDAMVSYINDKYTDDSFEFVKISGGHIGSNTTKIIKIDKELALMWLKKGAQPTDTAKNILSEAGVMKEFHDSKYSK